MRALTSASLTALFAAAAALSGCGGGSDDTGAPAAAAPTPAPAPAPAPAGACGTQRVLGATELAAFDGSYAVRVFDGSGPTPSDLGGATLALAAGTLTYTPDAGLTGASAATAGVTAVCENTNAAGSPIGVVAVIDAQRHVDFFSPAFSGLYVSGSDLGSAPAAGRYLQGTLSKNTPAPAPGPAPAPAPAPGGTYVDFANGAPATGGGGATASAAAWLAGNYYGRSSTGACSLQIDTAGQFVATMNGSTQTGVLDGEANDRAVSQPANGFTFGVTAVSATQAVASGGAGGRLLYYQLAGVLDFCAVVLKSTTPLTVEAAAAAPMPLKNSGLLASELPAAVIGTRQGYGVGTLFSPRTVPVNCTLDVAADGTVALTTGDRNFSARVDGGTGNAADASLAGRISGYQVLTGANGLFYRVSALSPSGASDVVEVQVELAHTSAGSQVTYASAQVRPAAGGIGSVTEACYFPN